jgi:hypothetical protein
MKACCTRCGIASIGTKMRLYLRQFRHQPAIGGVNPAHLRRFIFREPAVIRQILREMVIGAIGRDTAREQHGGAQA